jgi:hypothetical protein
MDRQQAPQASAAKATLPVSYALFTGLRTLNSVALLNSRSVLKYGIRPDGLKAIVTCEHYRPV